MRVIITGGSGLIGRALSEELIQNGYEVIVLSRNPDKISNMPSKVKLVRWDGYSSNGWGALVNGSQAIVNLAGESIAGSTMAALVFQRLTPERKRLILESRLNAARAVLQAISEAEQKPQVLIQASAVGYYGNRGDEELTEDSPAGQDDIAAICQKWEAAVADAERMGVRLAIIRTAGVVLSTQGGAFPFMLIPFKLFIGGPLGSGRQWFSWIHIEDEARAIRFLIENPDARGIFNLCAPVTITNAEFSRTLGRVLNRPAIIPTPAFLLRLAFGEKAILLLGSTKQIPKRLMELGFQFRYPQPDAAVRNLLRKE